MDTVLSYEETMRQLSILRKRKTIDEIATEAGVNRWWLQKLFIDEFNDPGVKKIERLARYVEKHAA